MSQDYRKLESDILALVTSIGDALTKKEADEVRAFIDVGEYGVAFETLCSIIKEEQKAIPESVAISIANLACEMDIDEDSWGDIAGAHPGLRKGPEAD